MHQNYAAFIDRLIHRYEGGYGWNKKDPGGPTKYGITCYDLAEHRGKQMSSMATWAPIVKDMTLAEAEAIYEKKYATAVRFTDLPSGPDCVMLDYAVNSGTGRPILSARAILGVGKGSRMDDQLLLAIRNTDAKKFVDMMCAERLHFMHGIRGGAAWNEFGHGWQSRVDDLRAYGEHLTLGSSLPAPEAPDLTQIVTPKATHVAKTAGAPTAAGSVTSGVAAHEAGLGYGAAVGIAAAVLVAGVAYEAWQSIKANTANTKIVIPGAVA